VAANIKKTLSLKGAVVQIFGKTLTQPPCEFLREIMNHTPERERV
jgi:hypothetical protein